MPLNQFYYEHIFFYTKYSTLNFLQDAPRIPTLALLPGWGWPGWGGQTGSPQSVPFTSYTTTSRWWRWAASELRVCLQVLRRMALGNGNGKAGSSLKLQRVVVANAATTSSSPARKGAGLTQLVVHPVLRRRTMVLMYIWWVRGKPCPLRILYAS